MENLWLLFAVAVIIGIATQLDMKFRLSYDVVKNRGTLKFSALNFPLFRQAFSVEAGYLKLVSKKNQVKLVPLDTNEQAFQEYADFNIILFRKIHFKKTSVFVNFGIRDDAFITSLISGGFWSVFGAIAGIVNTKSGQINFVSKIYPNYQKNRFHFALRANISLSIFDFLWCLMENLLRKRSKANG